MDNQSQQSTNQQQEFQPSPPREGPLQEFQPDKMMNIFVGVIISAAVIGGYLALAILQN